MSPSLWQILIVLVIVLIFFGPKRIPGIGKSLGEAIRGFKKGISDDTLDITDSAKAQPDQLAEEEKQTKAKQKVSDSEKA